MAITDCTWNVYVNKKLSNSEVDDFSSTGRFRSQFSIFHEFIEADSNYRIFVHGE